MEILRFMAHNVAGYTPVRDLSAGRIPLHKYSTNFVDPQIPLVPAWRVNWGCTQFYFFDLLIAYSIIESEIRKLVSFNFCNSNSIESICPNCFANINMPTVPVISIFNCSASLLPLLSSIISKHLSFS